MAQFMLLLHESPNDFAGLDRKELMAVIQEYQAWGQKMASEGKLVLGRKLKEEGGRHLSARANEAW